MSLKSRQLLNVGLLLLVTALALVAWLKPGHKAASESEPLARDASAAQAIRITLAGQPDVKLEREGRTWKLTAPLQWPADGALIQSLQDTLGAPVQSRFPAQGADLRNYGLDKPLAKLWLDGDEYDFGAQQPVSKQRYVLSGGGIELVDDYVFYRVVRDGYWWMDKRLVPAGAVIVGLQLPRYTVSRDSGGNWQLAPADKTVSPAALQRLIDAWQNASALETTALGRGKPRGEVALELAGETRPLRFQIRADEDYLVLARPDLGFEYHLDSDQEKILLAPAGDTAAPAAATR